MSKAEQIGHLCLMIHANVDHCRSAMLDADYGYVERLAKVANAGGYASEGSLEIMSLDAAEKELLRVAQSIKDTRNHLTANSLQYSFLKVVGES
jgi:hypothetical protein